MKEQLRGLSLKWKIILAFCVILLINALVTGVAFYLFAGRNTVLQYERNSQDMARQIELYLGDKIDNMTRRIQALGDNLAFVEPMRAFLLDDTAELDPILAGDIARMFAEIESGDPFISSLSLVTEKGMFDDYLLIRDRSTAFEDTEMYRHMQSHPEQTVAWFPAMPSPLYQSGEMVIPVVYRQRIANREIYFIAQLSQTAVADYLHRAYTTLDDAFIVDASGATVLPGKLDMDLVIRGFESAAPDQSSQRIALDGQQYLAAHASVAASGWQIYLLTPVAELMGSLYQLRVFLIVETFILLLLCATVILRSAHRMTASLEELADTMSAAANEDYRVEFYHPYHDEIGQLADSYNKMLSQIRRHIQALEEEKRRVQEVQRQKRKAELLALQSQINPHFLYNTLNMITWQAVDLGAEDISVISAALGKYFRISLSRGKEIIPLGDEMEHVKSYLEIQKIRYKSKLSYSIELAEDLTAIPVIKLILQPLVENALYHGIKPRKSGGCIWVFARSSGQTLTLTVEDDGVGIEPEKLDYLNAQLADGAVDGTSGYGIYNVNSRLQLYYGKEYGLRLESRENGGVRSVLTLPPCRVDKSGQAQQLAEGGEAP